MIGRSNWNRMYPSPIITTRNVPVGPGLTLNCGATISKVMWSVCRFYSPNVYEMDRTCVAHKGKTR
jgi:hypothetical protein